MHMLAINDPFVYGSPYTNGGQSIGDSPRGPAAPGLPAVAHGPEGCASSGPSPLAVGSKDAARACFLGAGSSGFFAAAGGPARRADARAAVRRRGAAVRRRGRTGATM